MKTSEFSSAIIILYVGNKIYKTALEHIEQCMGRIPVTVDINDLPKICNELNRIKEVISITNDSIAEFGNLLDADIDISDENFKKLEGEW